MLCFPSHEYSKKQKGLSVIGLDHWTTGLQYWDFDLTIDTNYIPFPHNKTMLTNNYDCKHVKYICNDYENLFPSEWADQSNPVLCI